MKRLFTIFAFILSGPLAHAQPPAASKEGVIVSAAQPMAFNSPISVQLLAGTQGLGADVKYGILPSLSARLGFGIVPVNANKGFTFSSFPVNGELAARFANVHLMVDFALFKSKFIRIVGGAAYLIKGNANALISPLDGYSIGGRALSKDQLGVIDAGISWRGFAPYAGLSLLKPFPARRFNVNLDLGTYYLSRPGTSFTGTNLFANNEAAAQRFNENMKGYRWMPVMQINFNIKIK
nr:hypothetical protein [uncultured Mucilaginibacter sp.]